MSDDEDPWGAGDDDDTKVQETAPAAEVAAAVTAAPTGEQTTEDSAALAMAPPPPEDDGYRKPVQLYKHWVRPRFLQYKYMYDYRTNYYDDVIDYLDKKQRGVNREAPRAQTWAERVLRVNASTRRHEYKSYNKEDKTLIQVVAATIKPHNYHSTAYMNIKYASIL